VREQSAISKAIEDSIKEKDLYEKSRLFTSLEELDMKTEDGCNYLFCFVLLKGMSQ
ncbi:unnamed protein product, partial [Larinioides sclopetarius]